MIAATNRPDMLDPALLRPGRLEKIIYVPPPDLEGRLEILKIHTREVPLDENVDLLEIAKQTEGYTGADLAALVREAAMLALRENINATVVRMDHFREALKKVKPSVSESMLRYYENWMETYRKAKREARRPEPHITY